MLFAAFEPTDNGEVLDRPEYKQIHDDYRNLVSTYPKKLTVYLRKQHATP